MITERELAAAAGWKAWKEARELVKSGRVTEANFSQGVYSAIIQASPRPWRPKVKIISPTDITTHCGCMDNRFSGALCAHGTAAVYAAILAPEEKSTSAKESSKPVERASVERSEGRVQIVFPKPFLEIYQKRGSIPCRWLRADDDSSALPMEQLGIRDGDGQRGILQISKAELPIVLKIAAQSGGGILWENGNSPQALRCSDLALRWPLELALLSADELQLVAQTQQEWQRRFQTGASEWIFDSQQFTIQSLGDFSAEDRETLDTLTSGQALVVSTEEFLSWSDWWDGRFSISPSLAALGIRVREKELTPRLSLSGGSWGLEAQLHSDASDIGVLSQDADDSRVWHRAVAPELDPKHHLDELGFMAVDIDAGKYELRGENDVRVFLAHHLDVLKEKWHCDILPAITAYQGTLAPLRPTFEFSSTAGQGEDWTSFDVGFRAPGSDRLSLAQIQQLLKGGRQTVKMKNGKTAVLSGSDCEEIEEILRDSDLRQENDSFQADSRHILFLREIAKKYILETNNQYIADSEIFELEKLIPNLLITLRPYQSEGVKSLLSCLNAAGGCLLADDMGLGKTLQSLSWMAAQRVVNKSGENVNNSNSESPFLVVCPASLLGVWVAELTKFLPDWSAMKHHGGGRIKSSTGQGEGGFEGVDVVVTTYSLVARDLELLKKQHWAGVVLDEASLIRNPKTQAAKAVFELQSPFRLALSGTPVENGVGDLWSLYRFLLPGYLGEQKDFAERYEKPIKAGTADRNTLARLRARIAPFMLRRVKSDVAKDLPEKIIAVQNAAMAKAQSDIYHSLLRDGAQLVADFARSSGQQSSRMQILTLLLRLRQVACDERLLGLVDENAKKSEEVAISGKLERLLELVDEALAGGHKILIFSQFTSMLELIAESLAAKAVKYAILTGSTRDRSGVVEEFQQPDGPPIFLISLKAGGYGLTLTEADTVIHFDPWWNPAVEAQATDRAHRIGQTRPVTVYKLVTSGTVEEKIIALQNKKQRIIDAAFDENQPLMSGLSDGDLIELLK